jgi:hypothetical protein
LHVPTFTGTVHLRNDSDTTCTTCRPGDRSLAGMSPQPVRAAVCLAAAALLTTACAGTPAPSGVDASAADTAPVRSAASPLLRPHALVRPSTAVGPATLVARALPPQVVTPARDDLPFEPSDRDRPSDGTGFTGHRPLPSGLPGGAGRGLVLGGVTP